MAKKKAKGGFCGSGLGVIRLRKVLERYIKNAKKEKEN